MDITVLLLLPLIRFIIRPTHKPGNVVSWYARQTVVTTDPGGLDARLE